MSAWPQPSRNVYGFGHGPSAVKLSPSLEAAASSPPRHEQKHQGGTDRYAGDQHESGVNPTTLESAAFAAHTAFRIGQAIVNEVERLPLELLSVR